MGRGRKPNLALHALVEHFPPTSPGECGRTICTLCSEPLAENDYKNATNIRRHIDRCTHATEEQREKFGSSGRASRAPSTKSKNKRSFRFMMASDRLDLRLTPDANTRLTTVVGGAFSSKDEERGCKLLAQWLAANNLPYHIFNSPIIREVFWVFSLGATSGPSGDSLRKKWVPLVYSGENPC